MKILTSLVIFLSFLALEVYCGYANFNCPTNTNSSVLLGCVQDCQQQHGANTGFCGDANTGDFHCYCDRSARVLQRSQLQCKEMSDGFRNLCTIDCVCNHAADGGHCMWDLGVCYCENQGKNLQNIGCPAASTEEWRSIAKDILKAK